MKKYKKLRYLSVLGIVVGTCVALIGSASPKGVHAAACGISGSGFYGHGVDSNGALLFPSAAAASVDSTVTKVGTEFTPTATLASTSDVGYSVSFATSGCANAQADLSIDLVHGNSLAVRFNSYTHSSSFVSTTDYKNLATGVTATSLTNHAMSLAYSTGALSANVAQLVSVDLATDAGWADIYLKQGTGTDTLLASLKLPTGAVAFYGAGSYSVFPFYYESSFIGSSCTTVTGSGEVKVRVLAAGTAIALTAAPDTSFPCGSFDITSYNSSTKTASLKYATSGITPSHRFTTGLENNVLKTVSGDFFRMATTLNVSSPDATLVPADAFASSTSASQQVYLFVENFQDGNSTPANIPYPVAAGTFDFSANDIAIDSSSVKLDVSATGYAALAHNLGSLTKDGSFSLFAPYRAGDQFVGVCPGATAIGDVNTTCSDLYFLKDGETKNGATATLITVGSTQFWRVDGVRGTGVFSSSIGIIPGSPDTGKFKQSAQAGYVVLGISALAIIGFKTKQYFLTKKRR